MNIVVTDMEGVDHTLECVEGWRVMEVIRDWGLPIKAECGGACSCATCHVYVDEDWLDRLHEPSDEEMDMLDGVSAFEDNSRLSCQIITAEDLDGLRVTLAPGSEPD